MHNYNWDDIRYVLAVIDAGTVSGAARGLGVNHATVLRRIAAFEEQHNIRLFNKTAQGYEIIPEYAPVAEALRVVQDSMQFMRATMEGQNTQVTGALRLTSTDTMCAHIVPDLIARIANEFPHLRLTVISTNTHMDLERGQVDLALRPTDKLPDMLCGDLVARMPFAVYAGENAQDAWIGMTGNVAQGTVSKHVYSRIVGEKVSAKADTFMVAGRLAQQGLGRAVLPCFVGDRNPGLFRLDLGWEPPELPLWVACHAELAEAPRVRALRQRLIVEMKALSHTITGLEPV